MEEKYGMTPLKTGFAYIPYGIMSLIGNILL